MVLCPQPQLPTPFFVGWNAGMVRVTCSEKNATHRQTSNPLRGICDVTTPVRDDPRKIVAPSPIHRSPNSCSPIPSWLHLHLPSYRHTSLRAIAAPISLAVWPVVHVPSGRMDIFPSVCSIYSSLGYCRSPPVVSPWYC